MSFCFSFVVEYAAVAVDCIKANPVFFPNMCYQAPTVRSWLKSDGRTIEMKEMMRTPGWRRERISLGREAFMVFGFSMIFLYPFSKNWMD